MHVEFDEKEGTVNLSSATDEEEALIDRIIIGFKKDGKLEYDGRDGADHGAPYSERMELFFKLGGDNITLVASSDEDERVVRKIRDAIFFGGGLHAVSAQFGDTIGKKSLNMCVNFCKYCGVPLVKMTRVEWKTCEACVAKCEHHYIHGSMHGGSAGEWANGLFCDKCGRGKLDHEPNYPDPAGERRLPS